MQEENLEFKRENRYTNLDVVVKFEQIRQRYYYQISQECKKYDRKIFIDMKNRPERRANAKNLIELMVSLLLYRGREVQISVEGEDEEARKIARRLYNALTLKPIDDEELNFEGK